MVTAGIKSVFMKKTFVINALMILLSYVFLLIVL